MQDDKLMIKSLMHTDSDFDVKISQMKVQE